MWWHNPPQETKLCGLRLPTIGSSIEIRSRREYLVFCQDQCWPHVLPRGVVRPRCLLAGSRDPAGEGPAKVT